MDGLGTRRNILRELGATKEQVTMFHKNGNRTIYTEDYRGRVSIVHVDQRGKPDKSAVLKDIRL